MLIRLAVALSAATFPSFAVDFSTSGPFTANNITLVDQKTPSELGLIDGPIMSDIWGWTDPLTGEEYVIAASDAHHAPFPIKGEDEAEAIYHPRGGVVFARLTAAGEIRPLGVWRHPTLEETDHGDVQVFANHAYVSGESPGYGLLIFDLVKLRGLPPCASSLDCAETLLNDVPGFGLVKTSLADEAGREFPYSNSHNLTIDEATGFMAIHAASDFKDDRQGKLRPKSTWVLKIDPAAPKNPILLADLNRASHDGLIVRYQGPDAQHQGKVLLFLSNGYKHDVIEINQTEVLKNPKNGPSVFQLTGADGATVRIKKLSQQITYANDDFGHQLALSEDHRYVFFNDEAQYPGNFARQIVFDFASLSKPILLYQCLYPVDSVTHDAYVVGDYLISGNYASGLRVVDISSVETTTCVDGVLNEAAWIDTEPRLNAIDDELTFEITPEVTLNSSAPFAGVWGNYPYFKSGFIVMNDFYNGIFSVKLDIP